MKVDRKLFFWMISVFFLFFFGKGFASLLGFVPGVGSVSFLGRYLTASFGIERRGCEWQVGEQTAYRMPWIEIERLRP